MEIGLKEKLEKEIKESESLKLLNWLNFLDYLQLKLNKEDLKILFEGIETLKQEARLEGRKNRKEDDIKIIDETIEYLRKILIQKLTDAQHSFLDKLKIDLEKIKKRIEEMK